MSNHINNYYKSVCSGYSLGNTETYYYQPICKLLTHYGCIAHDLSGVRSGLSGENIDILMWYGTDNITEIDPFAGIEVKKVAGIDDRAREQAQIATQRYGNVILTDNCIWRFYHLENGKVDFYTGVELISNENGVLTLRKENIELFESLINDFILKDPATIKSSVKLAEYMAAHARTIRECIKGVLKTDENNQPLINETQLKLPMFKEIVGLYKKIKSDLRPYLDTGSFADMYAQTIVYGLFIARYNEKNPDRFNRGAAIENLRSESALLKMFFHHIATTDKQHPTLEAVIDKLCNLYKITDVVMLLDKDDGKDTIVHFYEEFLSYYDPALRKSLGVFYTPHQVVRYLVSMVDKLLVEDFGIEGGLSNNETLEIQIPSTPYIVGKKELNTIKKEVPRVSILDPACGTGTFHAEVIKFVKEKYFSGGKEAFWKDYILGSDKSLASRLIGFEIMMTSYVVAKLKIRRTIHETLGAAVNEDIPHSNIYLTNTLAPPHTTLEETDQMSLFSINDFSGAVTEEARQADTWKSRRPIKVIIGNPPYLATSTTPYDIEAYKTEADGKSKLKEKNPKWLGDDYVKFFRFSEQIINKEEEGILAFISNNGYLENSTFRGMRGSLLRTFDKILIIDLHGNSKKKEVAPDGGKDENIFNIMPGVSLFIGVKLSSNQSKASVYHADLWGLRDSKLSNLANASIELTELKLDDTMCYFVPFVTAKSEAYMKGIALPDLFSVNVVGIVTARDAFCVQSTRENVESILNDFRTGEVEQLRSQYNLGKDTRDWTVEGAKKDVESNEGSITKITYRPFDDRYTYFTGRSKGFHCMPRGNVMKHMTSTHLTPVGKNLGMIFARNAPVASDYAMIFIVDKIYDHSILSTQTSTIASIAPLFLCDDFDGFTPNFNAEILKRLTAHMSFEPSPIEVFDYIYGILYDSTYRERFNDYLKRDFPRVPIINSMEDKDDPNAFYVSEDMFRAYIKAGERLRRLHLLQEKIPATLNMEPSNSDNLEIGAIKYKDGVLHLNAYKQILGISDDVWTYRIGGYQVLDKWFKSHKGETLNIEKYTHIENVVGLLVETIKIQEELKALHS